MTPSTTRPRTLVAALAIILAFVAAGCGSSGGSDASDTTTAKGDATTTAASGSSDAPVKLEGTVNDKGSKDISGDGDKADLEMELDDDYFSPTFIKAAPGATVTVELENEGDNPHTFTLDDGSVDEKLDPGAKATVEVTVPEDGSLRFSCDFHGSMGMQGAFYTGTGGSSGGDVTTTAASGSDSGSGGSGY
ncbi:MAG: cupredoxin domain-containing protein [Aquihabitans sp.]